MRQHFHFPIAVVFLMFIGFSACHGGTGQGGAKETWPAGRKAKADTVNMPKALHESTCTSLGKLYSIDMQANKNCERCQ